jgi:DNA-binding transcriptional ArsR family regulator
MLRAIAMREKTVGEIAAPYDVQLAAVSKHLKVPESADLIHREKRGSFQLLRLNAQALKRAEEWLSMYINAFNGSLLLRT